MVTAIRSPACITVWTSRRTSESAIIRFVVKPLVFLAGLGPAVYLVWAAFTGHLSVNPLSDVTNETGVWTLRFVCITLAITPLRRLTGWNAFIRFRRMMGLYAFFYGTLHFTTYVVLDRFAGLVDFPNGIVSWTTVRNLATSIGGDIYQRPFITIGFSALILMVPLAVTSTAGMIRRLGGRRWQLLHRLVYATAILGVVHYWWLVKADIRRPQTYAAVVGMLLGFRLFKKMQESRSRGRVGARPQSVPKRADVA
jgi:methionine sulfoxide reductase heme-binding subunit